MRSFSVVVGTTHIGVFEGQTALGRRAHTLLVQPILQDRFHAAVGGRADVDGPLAGALQPLVADRLAQAQDAQARPVALLRVAALMQDVLDQGFGVEPDTPGPLHQTGRAPALHGLVRRGHVRINGGMPATQVIAHMAGDARAAMKELNSAGGEPHVDLLAGEPVRHRVVVSDDLDVIVDADPRHLPLGELVAARRQCAQRGSIQFGEGRLTTAGQLLEGPVVQIRHQRGNGPVELIEAEETLVAQACQHPALDQEYTAFGLRLVFRATRPSGQHRCGVMASQLAVGGVELGRVEARGGNAALEIVRDEDGGDPLKMLKGPHMATDPVWQALAPGRLAVGVVRGPQHGDEDRRCPDLTAHRIDHRHGLPGVVDEQLLARGVGLAHAHRQPPDPAPVVDAEAAVAVTVGVLGLVLLPEQIERDPLAPQLAVHGGPIGLGAGLFRGGGRRVKLRLQRLAHAGW